MARESFPAKKERTGKIIAELKVLYPAAKCALDYRNAFELLVATILSAQCTDVRVNIVTPPLFKKYPTAEKMAVARQEDIEALVKTAGFFRSKAKSLLAASKDIVAKHAGKVPETMEELTALRGVGRKTANVVLGNAFGKNVGIVVDTHVGRLSRRLALTSQEDPVKVELDLIKLVPQEEWTLFSHWLISHGRAVCHARKPKCNQCTLLKWCPAGQALIKAVAAV